MTAVVNGGTHDADNLAAIHGQPCAVRKNAAEARQWHPSTRWPEKRAREQHPGIVD